MRATEPADPPDPRELALASARTILLESSVTLDRLVATNKRPAAYIVASLEKVNWAAHNLIGAAGAWPDPHAQPPWYRRISAEQVGIAVLSAFVLGHMIFAWRGGFRDTVIDLETPCWAYNLSVERYGLELWECTETGQFAILTDVRARIDEAQRLQGDPPP
jgi:hypothetical protein